MAKRFTDTEKWKDAWFMDLPSKYKLFWIYLLDECDNAGIWKVNFRVASFYIGEHLEVSEVKRILKDRIFFISEEYWYITKFIKYQYKVDKEQLNPKNKAHLSVINKLKEHALFKPLVSPYQGVQDKDKEKDKEVYYYTKKQFFQDWNKIRKERLKKDSFLNSLTFSDNQNLTEISKSYTREQIRNALHGLFAQKHVLTASMQSNPRHFLENFATYLQAYHDNNKNIWKE